MYKAKPGEKYIGPRKHERSCINSGAKKCKEHAHDRSDLGSLMKSIAPRPAAAAPAPGSAGGPPTVLVAPPKVTWRYKLLSKQAIPGCASDS